MGIVQGCNLAKEEGGRLDLSECQLVQVPDAIYHLMRDTKLVSCNLSGNLISKIPPKLAMSFTLITELDVSNNRISMLPAELTACSLLETVNISGNSFVQLPPVLAEVPSLIKVIASKNFIADVEVETLEALPALEHLDLEQNPLRKETYDSLAKMTSCRVILSQGAGGLGGSLHLSAGARTRGRNSIFGALVLTASSIRGRSNDLYVAKPNSV